MLFAGSQVGDIVTQFKGPEDTVNYGGEDPAYCVVILSRIGSSGSAVKVQVNTHGISGYDGGLPTTIPDPAQWVDVQTVSAAGQTLVTLTVQDDPNWIRVIVSTVGTNPQGSVSAGGRWHSEVAGGGGGAPSGAAGGDLTGTYPNPTIKNSVSLTTPNINVATGTSLNLNGATLGANKLAVNGPGSFVAPLTIYRDGGATYTLADYTIESSGDLELHSGSGGTSVKVYGGAAINFVKNGTWPPKITIDLVEKFLRVNGEGGEIAGANAVFLNAEWTVASLLARAETPSVGMQAFVTDGQAALAWGATIVGGGSTKYLVWYNGTNWTVVGK